MISDLELMEEELRELFHSQLLDAQDFKMAQLIVRQALQQEIEKRKRNE